MNLLIGPSKTILNASVIEEAILIFVDQIEYHLLKSVSKQFGNDFESTVEKGNGPEFSRSGCSLSFRNQGDERVVDSLEIDFAMIEVINKLVEVRYNNRPACFQESGHLRR